MQNKILKTCYCLFLLAISPSACHIPEKKLGLGLWRGIFSMQGQEVPFLFEARVQSNSLFVFLINGKQRIKIDDIRFWEDSVQMNLYIFDAQLRAKIVKDDSIQGFFIKNQNRALDIPFRARHDEHATRFVSAVSGAPATVNFSGRYRTLIGDKPCVGTFQQVGDQVLGSFLSPVGDYGSLEGSIINDTLFLSNFDGSHLFLFKLTKKADSLKGIAYVSKTTVKEVKGAIDASAELPSEPLSYLEESESMISFSYPTPEGNFISLADSQFKNKVVIVHLLGSWCPNCMDESNFLAPWYQENKRRGVEIVALAYEQKMGDYAKERVLLMKKKLNIGYPVLLAGTPSTANKSILGLEKIGGFPTTIIIGKDGKVRHIDTGFDGPGTGVFYQRFISSFNEKINVLLEE